jgi:hypothetical protein
MKESNFYSDEFEQLIREKTEQYKMYPSENVWKGVHNSLHTKRKWFISSMAFLVTGILFLSGRELIAPSNHPAARKLAAGGADGAVTDGSAADLSKTNLAENTPRPAFVSVRQSNTPATTLRHAGIAGNDESEESKEFEESEDPDQSNYKGLTITISNPVISQPDLSVLLSHVVRLPGNAPALTVVDARGATSETATNRAIEQSQAEPGLLDSWLVKNAPGSPAATARKADVAAAAARSSADGAGSRETAEGTGAREQAGGTGVDAVTASDEITARSVLESLSARGQQKVRTGGSVSSLVPTKSGQRTFAGGGELPDSAGTFTSASAAAIGEAADRQRINWLHDYAMYTLPVTPQRARTFLQLTLSPMVNYRTLSGGDYGPSKTLQDGPVALNHPGDAQNYAVHSPAFGFEFGGSLLYRVTRNLSVKGGLQFNYIRYKINAYTAKPQQSAGTLNSYYGYYTDSMAAMNTAGRFGGEPPQTLYNDYYQLSAPIGFELRVLGNERLQFNIGATIQPSYLLNRNSYMLTSDYSNFAKEPSLYRRWNVSGGVEAFLSYQTGPVRWQVGPEFRYQLLSSYTSANPVMENLKGYGLKFGITKMLP